MGTACDLHLVNKVVNYAMKAEGNQVTVTYTGRILEHKCEFCENPAVYIVSYTPKQK